MFACLNSYICMFNKHVVFIHIFIHSCSQYEIIKYLEYCKVNEFGEETDKKKKGGSEFCET